MRQALSEQLLASAATIAQHTGNPTLAVAMMTSAIELQDLPDKDRLIDGLRKASGMPPLNETEEERMQREKQEQEKQAQQAQQQQQAVELEMKERAAKIAETEAKAAKAVMDAELLKVRNVFEKLNTLKSGMEAGNIAVQSHGALPVVDQLIENLDSLLNLAGPEQEPTAQPDQQQQLEQQAMMQQQQQMEQQQAQEQAAMMQQQEQAVMPDMQQAQEQQPF